VIRYLIAFSICMSLTACRVSVEVNICEPGEMADAGVECDSVSHLRKLPAHPLGYPR